MTESKLSKHEQLKKRKEQYSKTLTNLTDGECTSLKEKESCDQNKSAIIKKEIVDIPEEELAIAYSGWLGKIDLQQINRDKRAKRRLRADLAKANNVSVNRRERFAQMTDEQLENERQKHRAVWDNSANLSCKKRRRVINPKKNKLREQYRYKKTAIDVPKNDKMKIKRKEILKKKLKIKTTYSFPSNIDSTEVRDIPKIESCDESPKNPLIELIDRVSTGVINGVEDLTLELNAELFRRVFPMFKTFYFPSLPIQRVGFENSANFLIKMLQHTKIWNMYNVKNGLTENEYNEIYNFLEENLINCISLFNDYCLSFFDNNNKDVENIINVTCSLKQLQTMFSLKRYGDESLCQLFDPSDIFYWPFVSIKLNFPNFSIMHENINRDEFTLIDIKKYNKKSYKSEDTFVYTKPSINTNEFLSNFIIKFLEQLKTAIDKFNIFGCSTEKTTELKNIVSEFMNDINLCPRIIETNTSYYNNLNPYPYIRYLSYPNRVNDIIATEEKLIENIRLQQLSYPRISFSLEKFNVTYHEKDDDIVFTFDRKFFYDINNSVIYRCTLCDEDLGSHSSSHTIPDHYSKYHGFETEWNCVKCDKTFSTTHLTKIRWRHVCDDGIR